MVMPGMSFLTVEEMELGLLTMKPDLPLLTGYLADKKNILGLAIMS